ncbi:MAG TPA: rod shape-determining protein MreC [Armatimonadota bacterium]|nr:rod shape-determining protein MreC [Armatimonadota bacterium]
MVIALNWWQDHARRQGMRSPAERMLITILSPSIRIAGAVRNTVSPDPQYTADPLPPVGMERLQQLEYENQQLRAVLDLRQRVSGTPIAAEVIGRGINPWQGYLILDKGQAEKVEPHMIVLTPDGVLGQVATVTAHTAEVLLLTDRASGIGAMIERTRETGVLKGGQSGQCQLVYLADQAVIQAGDMVVTSGLGEFYPKGLPLGKVVSVQDDHSLSSRTAVVAPAANSSTVEMVLLTK